nr:MAG TPA: hypothetical protein [Caudoviricetes sp.]
MLIYYKFSNSFFLASNSSCVIASISNKLFYLSESFF